ncbi:MAG: hypothetical protein FJW56_00720 [Actinobacteria bacterium]|nr:hypothetical protein [Actinomycetota bacterium]
MEKLSSTRVCLLSLLFLLVSGFNTIQLAQKEELEKNISKALLKEVKCKNIIAKVALDAADSKKFSNLTIRFEEAEIGGIKADFITIQLKQAIIDNQMLKKSTKFRLISSSERKVNILLSAKSLQNYLFLKAKEFGKKNVNIKLKFSPPYIECFYDVPKDEISSESIGLLSKFIPGDKLEGYAAFTFTIKNNELSAHSSKVILNHFLLPAPILKIFENRFNPFENIPTLDLIQYKVNKINVQSKYLLLSN